MYHPLVASRNLAYLQLLDKDPAVKVSFERCVGVLLRFPGLCRHNVWCVRFRWESVHDVWLCCASEGASCAAEITVSRW